VFHAGIDFSDATFWGITAAVLCCDPGNCMLRKISIEIRRKLCHRL